MFSGFSALILSVTLCIAMPSLALAQNAGGAKVRSVVR